jgi:hypothetical protein
MTQLFILYISHYKKITYILNLIGEKKKGKKTQSMITGTKITWSWNNIGVIGIIFLILEIILYALIRTGIISENYTPGFFKFFRNLRTYSQAKVHRRQILPPVPLVLLIPRANETCGKFDNSVNDTAGKWELY